MDLRKIILSALESNMVYSAVNESSFDDVVNDIEKSIELEKKTKFLSIYDNGGESLDRITIINKNSFRLDNSGNRLYESIGSCVNGNSVYLHTESMRGKHLGKKVSILDLDVILKERIIKEFEL